MLQQLRKIIRNRMELDRQLIANRYIKGEGIEIGALHNPLLVNRKNAQVKYVDRMSVNDLRNHYPELSDKPLMPVDYIADGELLESVGNASQDFVIANHFIEHCQNTILTIKNMLRVLRPGGVIFLAVPDKRFTFDKSRAITPLEHILKDYENGPEISREQHYREWIKAFHPNENDEYIITEGKKLMENDYSIHFHVWEKKNMDELLAYLMVQMKFDFEIDLSLRKNNSNENIYILRKNRV